MIHPQADWEWRLWRASFALLPFVPALSGLVILVLSGRVGWRSRRELWRDRDLRGLLVWVGVLLASVVGALHPGEALLGAFNFVPFVGVFAALSRVLTTTDRLRQLAWAIVVPSIGICAIGLGELFWGWNDASFRGLLGMDWRLVSGGTPPGRMSSVFAHANFLANYAAIALALGLGLWCDAWRDRRPRSDLKPQQRVLRQPRFPDQFPLAQLTLAIAIAANLICLALASSRNGWGIACLIVLAFLIEHRWWAIVAAIHGAIATVFVAAFAPDAIAMPLRTIVPYTLWGRLSDRMYPDRPLSSLRLTQWRYAMEMVSDRPFGGWGLRSFSSLYEAQYQFFLGHPHNLYLMLAAETGLIATLLLLAVVGGIAGRVAIALVRGQVSPEARSVVFSYAIAFLATSGYHLLDIPLFQVQLNLLGWALLAGLSAMVHPPDATNDVRSVGS